MANRNIRRVFYWPVLLPLLLLLVAFSAEQRDTESQLDHDLPDIIPVAVLDLQPQADISRDTSSTLTETLRSVMMNSGRFAVMDRGAMLERLVDAKVEQSMFLINADMLHEYGKAIDVPYIMTGTVSSVDNKYTLAMLFFDVEQRKIRATVDTSRVCLVSELPFLAKQAVLDLLLLLDGKGLTPVPSPSPTWSPVTTRTPVPTETPTPTPVTAWYKKWYTWGLGSLAMVAVIIDQSRPGSGSDGPTLTPTATLSPTTTPTPRRKMTMTPTRTPTFTPTPTFGCDPNTWEAYISDYQAELKLYMNCFESQNQYNVKPDNMVSWYESATLCLEQGNGKRLCRIDEWQLACRGRAGNYYPYGNTYDPNICHTEQDPDVGPFPCGSKGDCVSAFGIYDMSGNVSEWSATEVMNYAGSGRSHYKLGGDWASTGVYGCYDEKEWEDINFNKWTGYRCCRDVDKQISDTPESHPEKKILVDYQNSGKKPPRQVRQPSREINQNPEPYPPVNQN